LIVWQSALVEHAKGFPMTNIYVGNLAFSVTDAELRSAFEEYGSVANINIITDRETGRSRGFAFVEMNDAADAARAIEGLNLASINDRKITVNEARPKPSRSGGGGGGRRY
jgi:RNA recognition motif-containing protein